MGKKYSSFLFNTIAPFYGLFYNGQKRHFEKIIASVDKEIDLTTYQTILDVGCGTGAFCAVLNAKGLSVTGVEPAEKMLKIAKKKPENKQVTFLHASVLEKLPFDDQFFDVSIASYVAHGLQKHERKSMYAEMSRVTKSKVIIHDYNQSRNLITTVIEWLERGDYFGFIKAPEHEIRNCMHEMRECFSEVKVVNVSPQAAWYICTPGKQS